MTQQKICVTEIIHADGSSVTYLPDGSVYSRNPPGTFIIVRSLDLADLEPEGAPN